MATLVNPANLEKIEFNVTAPAEPGSFRVTIVTGTFDGEVRVISEGGFSSNSGSFKALLEPVLTATQFRKATAMVALAGRSCTPPTVGNAILQWTVDDAQATRDDESGAIQLTVDATVVAQQPFAISAVTKFMFQVTTLAKIA
jgi:hypothetical protein